MRVSLSKTARIEVIVSKEYMQELRNDGWTVEEIDCEPIEGFCENCDKPLIFADDYRICEDDVYLCMECYDAILAEQKEDKDE